jgi:hypothetical protein
MTSIESLTLETPDPAAADAVLAAAFGPGTPMRARGSEAGPITDPDGVNWEASADTDRTPDASR